MLERFLARLAAGAHTGELVLKDGMLLAVMSARCPTVEMDLLAESLANPEQSVLERILGSLPSPRPPGGAVHYLSETARARTIRQSGEYAGVWTTVPS